MGKILFGLMTVLALQLTANEENPWPGIKVPTSTPAESIGSYSAGCLRGAKKISLDGTGYQMMRPSRERFWGHPRLLQTIKEIASTNFTNTNDIILFGDMGQPRGGPTASMHLSHQNGLDFDGWFRIVPEAQTRPLTPQERENISATSFVKSDGITLTADWGIHQIEMLKTTAQHPLIERVLVNAAIKKYFCVQMPEQTWIRKLRPWYGHDDHYHARISCAKDDHRCSIQAPIPPGNGCDANLEWWFSEEAKRLLEEAKKQPPKMPVLPEECDKVLLEP